VFTGKLPDQQRLIQVSLNSRGCFGCSEQAFLLNEERAEALHMALMLIILQQSH